MSFGRKPEIVEKWAYPVAITSPFGLAAENKTRVSCASLISAIWNFKVTSMTVKQV
jgi:hypothetical protein